MKRTLWLLLPLVVLALVIAGCEKKKKVEVAEAELIGRWEAPSQQPGAQAGDKLIFVFQEEPCQDYGKWGYQVDEGDEVEENDVLFEYKHGNGWFGWRISDGYRIILINASEMETETEIIYPYVVEILDFSGNTMKITDDGRTYTMTKKQ